MTLAAQNLTFDPPFWAIGSLAEASLGSGSGLIDQISGWASANPAAGIIAGASILLISGIVLCLAGARVLRPLVLLAGAITGGLVGYLVVTGWRMDDVGIVPSEVVGIGCGTIGGLVVAMIVFRSAVTAASGALVGLLAIAVAAGVLSVQGHDLPQADKVVQQAQQSVHDARSELRDELTASATALAKSQVIRELGGQTTEEATSVLDTLKSTTSRHVEPVWQIFPSHARVTLLLSGIVGAAVGLAIGVLAPSRALRALTAAVGAGTIVASGVLFMNIAGVQLEPDWPVLALLGFVWLILAAAGVVTQHRQGRTNPAPA